MNRRIAIVGAASSGKSTLAEAAATILDTLWVPEYLREFVDTHGRTPVAEEQYGIACEQVAREEAAERRLAVRGTPAWLICDTTPLMTAVYSDIYFGGADQALLLLTRTQRYAHTFVTATDIPWVPDGLQRDGTISRADLHRQVLAKLEAFGVRYTVVYGSVPERVRQLAAKAGPPPAL
ncbi:MAG TPA: ATP-binding protein [Burkholderiaceae bacterium]